MTFLQANQHFVLMSKHLQQFAALSPLTFAFSFLILNTLCFSDQVISQKSVILSPCTVSKLLGFMDDMTNNHLIPFQSFNNEKLWRYHESVANLNSERFQICRKKSDSTASVILSQVLS